VLAFLPVWIRWTEYRTPNIVVIHGDGLSLSFDLRTDAGGERRVVLPFESVRGFANGMAGTSANLWIYSPSRVAFETAGPAVTLPAKRAPCLEVAYVSAPNLRQIYIAYWEWFSRDQAGRFPVVKLVPPGLFADVRAAKTLRAG
jgi:hypothetical protein